MKKQIGIYALIAVLILAVTCAGQLVAEDYRNKETECITNTAFITAVERATDINWTKEEDGTVRLTRENLEAIRAVTKLYLSYAELSDLSGIEWFTGLEVLDCSDNLLTELDLSQNSNLLSLRCNSNQLTELDLSHNTALIELYCYANQLTELDLSHNTALEDLDCGGNQLRSLDLSKNTKLRSLYCHSNQLSELDLSQNTALGLLDCYENQLSELDLSQNTALGLLDCYENQLSELDLSQNSALEWLSCYDNQLRSLDLSHNTALEELYCGSQKTSGGEVQELVLTLTAEQREIWDSYWVDATDEDANNYDVTLKE